MDHPPYRQHPVTLPGLARALSHLWQCARCGTWSTEKTQNGRCKDCR
ncbi:hypothetical protein OHU23_41365 (plasmid) [Streptomyces virginiae]